ncbi:Presenilin-like membrane protease, A22 family [Candidatus Methanophagaceae archaeon]|nr:Presenilin-like membrane protease, A22 family [Methanophagales archaeon]
MTENEEEEDYEDGVKTSIALYAGMGGFIVLTQIIAVLLATLSDIEPAFENPESMWNPIYFFVTIMIFTALILLVFKFGGDKLVYFVMLAAVAVTIYYVMVALEALIYSFMEGASVQIYSLMQLVQPYSVLPVVLTIILTLLLYKYPEWYVLDATGVIIAGGATAIFGVSLGIVPVLLLMIMLAIYDAIAVYKTKHMVSLAESIVDLRVPILFVLPRKRKFSLLKNGDMDEAFYMGLGDAIIPSILVVSAFVTYPSAAPALGTVIGILVGYTALTRLAGRGTPHAGLPFLNSGAIIGFVIGVLLC